ncbi:MAG TPA: Gfo/Idh/MocA family oxidoreductase [Urbifossiella sp.]
MPAESPLDRRKFFGSAAALSLSAASYGNVIGSNDRLGIGFIGCGGRAQAHIDLIHRFAKSGQAVSALAVCDVWDGLEDEYDIDFGGKITRRRYAQGLRPSARKCGLDPADRTRVGKDYRRVLALKDVDIVCISTPDHWHGKMAVDAMQAGKDVFVEAPMTRTSEEAAAVVAAWKQTGRIMTVGVQSMADPVWVQAFDFLRTGKLGHVAHAQTGAYRNDLRGQWRYYRLAAEMTPRSIDWDQFLGHRVEFAGRPIGPNPKEQPFDRAAFAQWRCLAAFSGGPITDLLSHNITHMIAAMGVRHPGRVAAGGGLYLELDGRGVPDTATIICDFEEGCQLLATATTLSGYPMEEVIRGRLGAIKFVKGGFQVFRDDPSRGAFFAPRMEKLPEANEFIAVESPRNETEALWENFLECVRSRRTSTFSPPDLSAAAVAITSLAERSFEVNASRGKPNQILGWSGGDSGSVLQAPAYQKLAGPWLNGKAVE